ncbi:MAG: recombinase family protein, partial [Fimbriiglobus sp.]|nr:recombinase family protein [Fimbriiglobus sp.]
MSKKYIVIYCRYSSDMQRRESCGDQEREVRTGLARLGVPCEDAVVVRDEGESGTKADRAGFQEVRGMIRRGQVAVLAVYDQSRLTRGENALAVIRDLVFAGGRFVAVTEGIDTLRDGWEVLVQVKEIQHGQTVRTLQNGVRRGQRGRVLDDGSTGDFPYGFESYYLDPDWQAQLNRRGPKPKKGIRVCQAEAEWVRRVFAWFVGGKSIGWIARELTRLKVPKGHRASTPGWHPEQVRRMLANAKYVGRWVWGKMTTVRDSAGRKKQVAVAAGEAVVRDRPDLRVVAPDVWEKAAARLAALAATFGLKDRHKPRGPKPNPADVYPRSPLGGLLACGACGGRMHQAQSNGRRYYACAGAKRGLCGMSTQVP